MRVFSFFSFSFNGLTGKSDRSKARSHYSGFTMIEILVVLLIGSVLAAIAAPAWLGFVNRQRLNSAQSTIYFALRNAQSSAKKDKLSYQVAFRTLGTKAQFSVARRVPSTATAADWNSLPWQNLDSAIGYDSAYITFSQLSAVPNPPIRRVLFDSNGNVDGNLGRVTVTNQLGSGAKACVFVSTLIGATRMTKDNGCTIP